MLWLRRSASALHVIWSARVSARYDERSYLTLDLQDDDAMNQLQGHSITYRIAVGPQQGGKAFTLPTIPSWEDDDFGTNPVGKIAGLMRYLLAAPTTGQPSAV